ncbi:protein YgfX [Paraburkholderia hayleyella]|uniref:protein YgfX n=1 Tax=Paraburkholderia hayleyella TaxID=2152889 RepID=UPI001291EB0E|nr:protein YgfX [Paraburkholderia hayleyella]
MAFDPAAAVALQEDSRSLSLRPSFMLEGTATLFAMVALAAVCQAIGRHFGWVAAGLAGLVTLVLLLASALRYRRRLPVLLKIRPDSLLAQDRRGMTLAQGQIAGCTQWAGCLLVIVLINETGRAWVLLVAADALAPNAFRELAVLARRRSHA